MTITPELDLSPIPKERREAIRRSLMGNLRMMGRIYQIMDPLRLLKQVDDLEARVAELDAEVRRLTASLAEMRECYIARTEDRDRAEARVAELEGKQVVLSEALRQCEKAIDYTGPKNNPQLVALRNARAVLANLDLISEKMAADARVRIQKAEADRAVLVDLCCAALRNGGCTGFGFEVTQEDATALKRSLIALGVDPETMPRTQEDEP